MPLNIEISGLEVHVSSRLIGADEFRIPDHRISAKQLSVEFNYPLHRPAIVSYQSEDGFTAESLVDRVCKTYQEIYDEDRLATKNPQEFDGGGTYGIWGHGLDELWIESISRRNDGVIELGIGSAPSPFWVTGLGYNGYFASIIPSRHEFGFVAKGEIEIFGSEKPVALFDAQGPTLPALIEVARAMALEICEKLDAAKAFERLDRDGGVLEAASTSSHFPVRDCQNH